MNMDLVGSGLEIDVGAVVLDIGIEYTKVGFSKQPYPKHILETPFYIKDSIRSSDMIGTTLIAQVFKDKETLQNEIEEFLKDIFILKTQIDAKNHTIVVCEQLIFPRTFMNALGQVLFERYRVQGVYFFLANVLPLYTTGLDTGIIVDSGFMHTSVSIVWQTVFTIQGLKHEYMGASNLEHKVKQLLYEDNPEQHEKITTKAIKDVMCKWLRVLTRQQNTKFNETEENITKMKQKFYYLNVKQDRKEFTLKVSYYTMVSAAEIFFTHYERSESQNMAWMVCDSILEAPNRILVVQNLILSGGVFMIPGLKKRLIEEIHYAIETIPKYSDLQSIQKYIKVEKWIYPANCLVWIGASMLACLNQEIDTFLITCKEYIEEYECQLPDRFGHWFLTCSRETEPEIEDKGEGEDAKEDRAIDDKFETPVTKRPLNYFNKEFEQMNNTRKESLYLAVTPYSTRGVGRPTRFQFPK